MLLYTLVLFLSFADSERSYMMQENLTKDACAQHIVEARPTLLPTIEEEDGSRVQIYTNPSAGTAYVNNIGVKMVQAPMRLECVESGRGL